MKASDISVLLAQEVNDHWAGVMADTLGWEVVLGDKKAIFYNGNVWTLVAHEGRLELFPGETDSKTKRGRSMQVAPVYVAHPPTKKLSKMPLRHRGASRIFYKPQGTHRTKRRAH